MKVKDIIYSELVYTGREMSAETLSELDGVGDRTYASRVLNQLIREQKVEKRKAGRNVLYHATGQELIFEEHLSLKNLHEDDIWQKINATLSGKLSDRTESILYFAFTEMLNNAIDHSKSGTGYVKLWRDKDNLKFTIRDFGIGLFRGIMTKKNFSTETDALLAVLKGRLTTDPSRHSGEGIFWTSKAADKIVFTSYNIRLTIDNIFDDYAVETLDESVLGTEINFEISTDTEKSMLEIFHSYSFDHEKTVLDTTSIPVKLYDGGEAWVSRSQAKKLLEGLDKFKKIVLDFKNIKLIGQGFADEIFRVWQNNHPDVIIDYINANESVEFMIRHAKNTVVE